MISRHLCKFKPAGPSTLPPSPSIIIHTLAKKTKLGPNNAHNLTSRRCISDKAAHMMATAPSTGPRPSTANLPRILCLHGGGVNAEVFRLQSRALVPALSSNFRLVFAEAPFLSDAGPGILPVFDGCGPWKRWLRWKPEMHAEIDEEDARSEIEYSLRTVMVRDNSEGGTGEWVGLLGFSQGAKVAVSMLYETQLRILEAGGKIGPGKVPEGFAGGHWRFAVLMAGRGPIVKLSDRKTGDYVTMANAAQEALDHWDFSKNVDKLQMPTFHVHGTIDPGIEHHRRLLAGYCEPGTTRLMEWEGDHRIPIKTLDIKEVVEGVKWAAEESGLNMS